MGAKNGKHANRSTSKCVCERTRTKLAWGVSFRPSMVSFSLIRYSAAVSAEQGMHSEMN